MARRTQNLRATDRLNLALMRISSAAELMADQLPVDEKITLHRKHLDDAIDEAHSAMSDIRHAVNTI
ncbi:MAG TPA: hypothetical protein VGH47_04270 [Xanthobacteraceae bacterium]|jgi:hypothetical protein